MELSGSYSFAAPRSEVWDALMDPEVLANMLPGTEKLEKVGENEFAGVLNVRVGPVQGRFNGKVVLSELQPPERFHITVDGRGAAGFVRGAGDVVLSEQDGTTVLSYEGAGDVGGRIAGVGQRLVETSGKSLVRQGLESLDRIIQARRQPAPAPEGAPAAAPAAATAPSPEITPPSELAVGMQLAKDIFEEYVPEEQRPLVLGAVGALLALIGVAILRKLFSR